MKQIPKIALAITIIFAAAILTELFLTLPESSNSEREGKVLAAIKKATKKPAKPAKKPAKKTTKKKTTSPAPAPTPKPAPTPAPSSHSAPTTNTSIDLSSLEREINIVYQDAKTIGQDHYNRLKSELDSKAAAGADATKIKKLREMLETVNPANVTSTAPPSPPKNQTPACPDDTKPVLTADITDFAKIQKITAPGSPVNDQDKYKGHSFIWTNHQRVPVYAPVDAILDSVAYQADNENSPYQYALGWKVKVNCNYSFKFDHIDEVVPAIQAVAPAPTIARRDNTAATEPSKKIAIEFQAGDLVGYTTGTRQAGNWDFGFYNTKEEGPLAAAGAFGLGRHAVCWVDYYLAEKQSQYRRLLDGPKLVCSFE